VTFKWQQGSVVVELDLPHSIARPPKPPVSTKILEISLTESELGAYIYLCIYYEHRTQGTNKRAKQK